VHFLIGLSKVFPSLETLLKGTWLLQNAGSGLTNAFTNMLVLLVAPAFRLQKTGPKANFKRL
jgi:hypothetical protein